MPGIPKDGRYFENDIDQITFHSSLSANTNGETTTGYANFHLIFLMLVTSVVIVKTQGENMQTNFPQKAMVQ